MITKNQWFIINDKALGLRSEDNETTIKGTGASYAMNMGIRNFNLFEDIPENWNDLLEGTIKAMQSYSDYETRYLMIVSPSNGSLNTFEYYNCFPKSSVRPGKIWSVISLNRSLEELIKWVESNINNCV